jgi:two-component system chemotaxis response regulator CheB
VAVVDQVVASRVGPDKVVVIGGSAGGLDALRSVLPDLSPDGNAAFFVVIHIPPYERTQLAAILSQHTFMPVQEAVDGLSIKAGHVYVGAPDRHLMLENGVMRLTRGPKECRARPSINVLFRSAAVVYGDAVLGVVLSGALDDGAAGLWAIKDAGGVALVQEPSTAQHPSMPQNAIEGVDVDAAVPIAGLAQQIAERLEHMSGSPEKKTPSTHRQIENSIAAEGNGLRLGVMDLGKVSKYTCPDCHGVLVQIEEGRMTRFRCHTGHAFSMRSLLAETSESIDNGLWAALRSVEERIMLLRQLGEQAAANGNHAEAERCALQAADAERKIEPLRRLVLDPVVTGRLVDDDLS